MSQAHVLAEAIGHIVEAGQYTWSVRLSSDFLSAKVLR